MGGFSRKGLNYFGQSKQGGRRKLLPRMAKIGKNHFLPHSITLAYKEIKCIFEKRGFMPQGQSLPSLPLHWLHHCLLILAGGAHRRRYSRTTPSPTTPLYSIQE